MGKKPKFWPNFSHCTFFEGQTDYEKFPVNFLSAGQIKEKEKEKFKCNTNPIPQIISDFLHKVLLNFWIKTYKIFESEDDPVAV